MTADDVLPLIDSLTRRERTRLLHLITKQPHADATDIYEAVPPRRDEFSTDEDPLAWEAEGWEDVD